MWASAGGRDIMRLRIIAIFTFVTSFSVFAGAAAAQDPAPDPAAQASTGQFEQGQQQQSGNRARPDQRPMRGGMMMPGMMSGRSERMERRGPRSEGPLE